MILAVSALLIALAVGCGSAGEANGGAGPGPGAWVPPAGPADIAGPVSTATPSDPPADDCVPSVAQDGNEPVSSSDPRTCGSTAAARLGTLLIADGTGRYGSATISVQGDTDIRGRTDAGYEAREFATLTPGARLEVWFEGPVAESYPVQATAGTIVIGG